MTFNNLIQGIETHGAVENSAEAKVNDGAHIFKCTYYKYFERTEWAQEKMHRIDEEIVKTKDKEEIVLLNLKKRIVDIEYYDGIGYFEVMYFYDSNKGSIRICSAGGQADSCAAIINQGIWVEALFPSIPGVESEYGNVLWKFEDESVLFQVVEELEKHCMVSAHLVRNSILTTRLM